MGIPRSGCSQSSGDINGVRSGPAFLVLKIPDHAIGICSAGPGSNGFEQAGVNALQMMNCLEKTFDLQLSDRVLPDQGSMSPEVPS